MTLEQNFIIGINCFPGNNKYKFKRLLVSLLMKPEFNSNWYPKSILTDDKFESQISCYYRKESEFILSNLLTIPNKSLFDMIKFLESRKFKHCESNICVEFLIDGIEIDSNENQELKHIISEFKTIHNNTIISGTKEHTNLTINRNIFLNNHKKDYVCFCDDDDISCSIDTKFELFKIYLIHIYHKIISSSEIITKELLKYNNSDKLISKFNQISEYKFNFDNDKLYDELLNLENDFRKLIYDFLLTIPNLKIKSENISEKIKSENIYKDIDLKKFHGEPIKEPIILTDYLKIYPYSYANQHAKNIYYSLSYFGPHFFQTYTTEHNGINVSYGFWSLIIPPWTIDNYTNVKEVRNEDIVYDIFHHLIRPKNCLVILNTKSIYFYLSPSHNDYQKVVSNDSMASLGNTMMFGPNQKFKLSRENFEYDSIVEYIHNNIKTLEFVSDRDFRGYTIQDVQKYIKSINENISDSELIKIWNDLIKQYDL